VLESAGSVQIGQNQALASLSLPALASLPPGFFDGGVSIGGNAALTNLSIPRLTDVAGSLDVISNGSLAGLSFPILASVGGLRILRNDVLVSLSLPALLSAAAVEIENNALLTACTGTLITNVGDCVQ
jgi:hypothetical protein